ncbi:MAG: DUF3878 family protein [Lachnospiraceae bacterium]|nr:DUF3878 family protein [Lachnospiraceae bacterium]
MTINIPRYRFEQLQKSLPGLQPDMPEGFFRLAMLLTDDLFEPVHQEKSRDYRLIYQMNDAVESFLIFKDCHSSGNLDPSWEGPLEASLEKRVEEKKEDSAPDRAFHQEAAKDTDVRTGNHTDYVLILRQGPTPYLLFFSDIEIEDHYYNYCRVGHNWVQGQARIRNLSCHIWNLWDKYTYMGSGACSPLEQRLVLLNHFPPLNYTCYSYLPEEYIIPFEGAWKVDSDAVRILREYIRKAGDYRLGLALSFLEWIPSRRNIRRFARLLQKPAHQPLLDLIWEDLDRAGSAYPDRVYDEKREENHETLRERAEKRKALLENQGKRVVLLQEEPFLYDESDELTYKVLLLIQVQEGGRVDTRVETFQ